MTTIEICKYALTLVFYDNDDVGSSYLELKNQVQDQIKEQESTTEEIDQLGVGSSYSQGLKDYVPY